ncbi:MAG: ABC transporter ATP-binding protein [Actinomycetes bacterium]
MIRLVDVTKRFGDSVAVDHLCLDIAPGGVTVLIGPSGCGKTTTLKMINRLIEPTEGRIVLGGEDISTKDPVLLRRHIGYVIQHSGLFPHRTVRDNVATVPRLLGWTKDRTRGRVDELLDLVGLPPGNFGRRYPHQLSGGQRQRVGVARALAADPPVLLMDEPFGAIDPVQRDRLQKEFRALQDTLGKTVVLVTHDLAEAVRLGDRIAVLAEGGRLAQYDSPTTLLGSPASDFVQSFVGDDRLVTRLSVSQLLREDVEAHGQPSDGLPIVTLGESLRRVLQAVMEAPDGRVAVKDGDVIIGTVTPTALHAAVRRSLPTPT